jgi:hypothetical protein
MSNVTAFIAREQRFLLMVAMGEALLLAIFAKLGVFQVAL